MAPIIKKTISVRKRHQISISYLLGDVFCLLVTSSNIYIEDVDGTGESGAWGDLDLSLGGLGCRLVSLARGGAVSLALFAWSH